MQEVHTAFQVVRADLLRYLADYSCFHRFAGCIHHFVGVKPVEVSCCAGNLYMARGGLLRFGRGNKIYVVALMPVDR